jgi:hypothetical protein
VASLDLEVDNDELVLVVESEEDEEAEEGEEERPIFDDFFNSSSVLPVGDGCLQQDNGKTLGESTCRQVTKRSRESRPFNRGRRGRRRG